MTFDLCTISTTLAAVAVIDLLYETLRSAACSIFVSIFTRHHTPGAGSARLLRLWRFNYRARCYCRKPLRAYQRLIARVKRNCINKHTKRENTHTKSIAAWVASPFYCFFFLTLLRLPGPCLGLHLLHYSISTDPPKTAR